MSQALENPMVDGVWSPEEDEPDMECPNCHRGLFADSEKPSYKLLSASGKYCADCIESKVDTLGKRLRFLRESNVLDDVIAQAIADYDDEYNEWLMEIY